MCSNYANSSPITERWLGCLTYEHGLADLDGCLSLEMRKETINDL
jgi:hypothetical protein